MKFKCECGEEILVECNKTDETTVKCSCGKYMKSDG